jgi:hypothetical protein
MEAAVCPLSLPLIPFDWIGIDLSLPCAAYVGITTKVSITTACFLVHVVPSFYSSFHYCVWCDLYACAVLTQSARAYVYTGDSKWRDRYNAAVQPFTEDVAQVSEVHPEVGDEFLEASTSASLELLQLDAQALALRTAGNITQALVCPFSVFLL